MMKAQVHSGGALAIAHAIVLVSLGPLGARAQEPSPEPPSDVGERTA
jgi:hypothetical protein